MLVFLKFAQIQLIRQFKLTSADDSSDFNQHDNHTTRPQHHRPILNRRTGRISPIPALCIVVGGDRTVSSGADSAFTAVVYDNNGNKRDDAIVSWSFGDGMRKTGASVFHSYYDPGEYAAVVHASTPDGGDARAEIIVKVEDAGIKIASVSARGITLVNNGYTHTRSFTLAFVGGRTGIQNSRRYGNSRRAYHSFSFAGHRTYHARFCGASVSER